MFDKKYYEICAVDDNFCDGVCRKKHLYYARDAKCPCNYSLSREQYIVKKLGKKLNQKQLNKILKKYSDSPDKGRGRYDPRRKGRKS